MPKVNQRLGVGATGTIPVHVLHPKKLINEKYGSKEAETMKLMKCLVIGGGIKKINGREVFAVLLAHTDFNNRQIYAAASLFKVDTYGVPKHVFKAKKDEEVREV